MKFERTFREELRQDVETVSKILNLCNRYGKALSNVLKQGSIPKDDFLYTALEFTRLNRESGECTLDTLRAGFLVQCHLLLRWHLEMAQLLYYLWKNPPSFRKWLAGEQLRPEVIGKYFQTEGLATWREPYEDWSNVVHGNHVFVEHSNTIARMRSLTDEQVVVAGSVLHNLMFCSHKINHVSGKVLLYRIEMTAYNDLAKTYNEIETAVLERSEAQLQRESDLMNR